MDFLDALAKSLLREGPPEYQQIYKGPAGAKFFFWDLSEPNERSY